MLDNGRGVRLLGSLFSASTSAFRGLTLQSGGGELISEPSGNYTFQGPITGPGALTITGGGTVVLGAVGITSTYLVGTTVADGSGLVISADVRLGVGGSSVTLNGGTLVFSAATSLTNRPITIGANNGTLDTSAGTRTTPATASQASARWPSKAETRSPPTFSASAKARH